MNYDDWKSTDIADAEPRVGQCPPGECEACWPAPDDGRRCSVCIDDKPCDCDAAKSG